MEPSLSRTWLPFAIFGLSEMRPTRSRHALVDHGEYCVSVQGRLNGNCHVSSYPQENSARLVLSAPTTYICMWGYGIAKLNAEHDYCEAIHVKIIYTEMWFISLKSQSDGNAWFYFISLHWYFNKNDNGNEKQLLKERWLKQMYIEELSIWRIVIRQCY